MVKLTGPMMSIAASGKFADTMVFAKKGGTAYARQRVIPFNPRSPAQTGLRAMMKFLSQEWSGFSDAEKATWATLAASLSGVNFNAYTHYNLQNLKQFLAPSVEYPATRSGTPSTVSSHLSVGQVGQVQILYQLSTLADGWGIMLFRDTTTGFTPSPNNLVALLPTPNTSGQTYVDSGLQPGTYYYGWRKFTRDGVLSAAESQTSANVT